MDFCLVTFSKRHLYTLAIFSLLILIAVAFHMHGFSVPLWHKVIDDSPMTEVVVGTPQLIRSDDWTVNYPLALAQILINFRSSAQLDASKSMGF